MLILDNDFFNKRFQTKISLNEANYEELGSEFDDTIFGDKDFIKKIILQEENYPDEHVVTDFYEEVRSILDGKTRYSNYWLLGLFFGFFLFAIVWMIILPRGWL